MVTLERAICSVALPVVMCLLSRMEPPLQRLALAQLASTETPPSMATPRTVTTQCQHRSLNLVLPMMNTAVTERHAS